MVSAEKKQRFSELLKYIRGLDGVKKFAARLEIKLPTYSAWETARAFPSDETWETLLPKLCELSGFTADLIDGYLRGDYELADLIEGFASGKLLPRARPIITLAKFRAWLQTLSLTELIQVLKETAERAGLLVLEHPNRGLSQDLSSQNDPKASSKDTEEAEFLRHEVDPQELTDGGSVEGVNFRVDPIDEEAVVKIIFQLAENLSLEKMVQLDNHLRELIFLKVQELGVIKWRRYQNNPFSILMEEYRVANSLSYEQFEDNLLAEGIEAGLDPARVAKIVRGQSLPDDREIIWIGVFIRKADGSLYNHEELIALRDGTFSLETED